jgi:hypothetical protein
LLFFTQEKGITDKDISEHLNELETKKIVFKLGDFYALKNDSEFSERRIRGNNNAKKMLEIAKKKSQFIARFPYVKGVFISGSLSKNYIDEDGDIDYFLITKPNRLWIARTLLVLYKKVFLFNSRKYFCVNYFIDENNLEIEEKNLFTATEISTLLPMVNETLYHDFMIANNWVKSFYPESTLQNENKIYSLKKGVFTKMVQSILNTKFGDVLDTFFMRKTLKRWQKKFKKFTPQEFELLMRTNKRVSKHHPSDFQTKVITSYENRVKDILKTYNIESLNS